jgi:hypothetical protein
MSKETTTKVGDVNVTLNPSQQVVKAALKDVTVVDALGRSIRLKKPSPLANLDFKRALGANHENVLYLVEVMPLAYVVSLDGEVVVTPSTDTELRALYQRLGDEGNDAIRPAVFENFIQADQVAKEAELKNS